MTFASRERGNFSEMSFLGTFRGWGYQDFATPVGAGPLTISDNENGTDVSFLTSHIVGESVVIVNADNPSRRVYTSATPILGSVVTATNAGADPETVTLSAVPNAAYNARVYYLYNYDEGVPISYSVPPKAVASLLFAEIETLLITEQELSAGTKTIAGVTINALTISAAATGFTVAGGTTSKILTLDDDLTASTILSHLAGHSDTVLWSEINKTVSDIADITTKSHTSLSDIGTNTHATLDTFKTTLDALNGLMKCNGAGAYSAITDSSTNWDTAYNDKINSIGWTAATGVITLTQQDAGTLTVDIGLGTGDSPIFTAQTLSNPPRARAYLGSNQTIGSGAPTKIEFDAEDYDTSGDFSTGNHRYTPDTAGYYQVNLAATIAMAGDKQCVAYIYKNGASIAECRKLSSHTAATTPFVADVVYCDGDSDYIEGFVYQNTGANQTLYGNTKYTWISIHRLS